MKPVISEIRHKVWIRAAGRRQLAGCNRSLPGDALASQRSLDKVLVMHIVADEPNGPVGDTVLSRPLVNEPVNLMLSATRRTLTPALWGARRSEIEGKGQ